MTASSCRACRSADGEVVLDLGDQPASDWFPPVEEPGPDPLYPLQMWFCSNCGLAQLLDDPTVPEEPKGTEPAALVKQATAAVERVGAAGLLPSGSLVAEYGSPHGGSWSALMAARGISMAPEGRQAEIVLDCFGLMHCTDQAGALAERVARVAPGGIILIQYHSLATVVRRGQWTSLRHGHYAYYSTSALIRMLRSVGFFPLTAWEFELYGGTILLAATRDEFRPRRDPTVRRLISAEEALGLGVPDGVRDLQRLVRESAETLRNWLLAQRTAGRTVLGYGAASRAVAMLNLARIDNTLLPGIADASTAKQGRRMPGTDIPVISPGKLAAEPPDLALLFLPDLLAEVNEQLPEIVASGGRWIHIEELAHRT